MSNDKIIKGKIIGIDLGTTNSCVCIYDGIKVKTILNPEGNNTTPSIIGYKSATERIVGDVAKRSRITVDDTLYRTKSFMGLNYDEAMLKTKDHPMSYKIGKGDKNNVVFNLKCGINVTPEESAAEILRNIVSYAEAYIGEKIEKAVVTVPAYFNDAQRQATKDAGKIAGIDIIRIINEPTAAALAYGLDKKKNGTIAVYDLGGGTFDVSILTIEDGVFEVLSTNGNTYLGGEDFDNLIIDYLITEFEKETRINLRGNKEVQQRLKEAAEKAKIDLSSKLSTEINLPFITADSTGAKHLNISITRAKFESLIDKLLNDTKVCCEKAIKDSGVDIAKIDQVLLVGGSTRIPCVKDLVKKIFNKEPSCDLNPDEVVAQGAAIQAGVLSGDVQGILLLDVIPMSLGIETLGGIMTKLVERNTTIPVKKTQIFSTAADNQSSVSIFVYQGEREMAANNKKIGQFELHGIPPAPRGIPQIEVSFDIDANGILDVSAVDKNTGKKQNIIIQGSGGLSKEEIEKMMADAEAFKAKDLELKELIELRNKSDNLIYTSEKSLKETQNLPEELKSSIEAKTNKLKEIMNSEDKNEIQSAFDDLSSEIGKIYEHTSKQQQNQPQDQPQPEPEPQQ